MHVLRCLCFAIDILICSDHAIVAVDVVWHLVSIVVINWLDIICHEHHNMSIENDVRCNALDIDRDAIVLSADPHPTPIGHVVRRLITLGSQILLQKYRLG